MAFLCWHQMGVSVPVNHTLAGNLHGDLPWDGLRETTAVVPIYQVSNPTSCLIYESIQNPLTLVARRCESCRSLFSYLQLKSGATGPFLTWTLPSPEVQTCNPLVANMMLHVPNIQKPCGADIELCLTRWDHKLGCVPGECGDEPVGLWKWYRVEHTPDAR